MKRAIAAIHSIFKTFILSSLIIGQVHFAYAQTASILPPAKTSFYDVNGNPVTSGTVEFFVPGQNTHKTTWQDSAETIPNENPLHLDAAGRAIIWGDGAYRQVVKDSNHNLIWDAVTASPGAGGAAGAGSVGDSNSVGAIVPWSGFTLPAGYLYAAGQAVVRTTYPLLYSLLTQTSTVTCTGGNPTLTSLTNTEQLNVGAAIEAICVTGPVTIISKTATSVTLSANATLSISTTAIFYPYGNGDGLTTFNLPDYRGVVLPGRNNMNGVASANLTNPTYTDPNSLNGAGGSQTGVIATANLPPYTPTGTSPGGVFNFSNANGGTGGTNNVVTNITTSGGGSSVATQPTNFNGIPQGGTSKPFSLIQPSKTVNYIIKVLPNPAVNTAVCANLQDAGTACQADVGTSGHVVPFLDGANAFSGANTFSTGVTIGSKAAALVGNSTSTAGPDVDFTIQGLAAKVVPDANNDFLLLWDNVANNFKKVTPGQLGSTGVAGVTSLDAVTGAITAQTGSLKVVSGQLSSNVLSSRAFASTQNLSSFGVIKTLGYAVSGDGGEATFKNTGATPFVDSFITAFTTTGGSGYTNGSYFGIFLANTTKPVAVGTATVSGGIVGSVDITGTPGGSCHIGDVYTTGSIPGGSGFSITVTGCSTPFGSFTDSAGNHFQITFNGSPTNIRQFGAKGDWQGTDATATDNFNSIQAAQWYAGSMNGIQGVSGNGGYWGSTLKVPQGSYMACGTGLKTLINPYGVAFEGDGNQSSVIRMCDTFNPATHFFTLCDPNWHSACFNSLARNVQFSAGRTPTISGNAYMVYSNSTQDFGGLHNVYIYSGQRGCVWFEKGFGGASSVHLDTVSCSGLSNISMIRLGDSQASGLNFGSTLLNVRNIVLGGPSTGPSFQLGSGIFIQGGFANIDNVHCEEIINCVEVNIPVTGNGDIVRLHNVNAGSGAPAPACTGTILLSNGNTPGNTIVGQVPAGSCSNVVANLQSGGTGTTSPVVLDRTFP